MDGLGLFALLGELVDGDVVSTARRIGDRVSSVNFAGDVVIADTLVVGPRAISSEDEQSARIRSLMSRGGDVTDGLWRLEIGLVVVELNTPGVGRDVTVNGQLAHDGPWLQL
ncbi:MAG: hypothetical protein WKF54_12545 [Nocardioidaceae bacterium]